MQTSNKVYANTQPPRFERVIVTYLCGCAYFNDTWISACESPGLCPTHSQSVMSETGEWITGVRPLSAETKQQTPKAHLVGVDDPKIKTQTVMLAKAVTVDCPYCHKMQDGFYGNPAGDQFTCDDCGELYKIHSDADIDFR